MLMYDSEHKITSFVHSFVIFLLFLCLLFLGPGFTQFPALPNTSLETPFYDMIIKRCCESNTIQHSMLYAFALLIGFRASYIFTKTLSDIFKLPSALSLIAMLFLLSPYFTPVLLNLQILHEFLTYPLFLYAMSALFKGLAQNKFNQLLLFFIHTSLLLLLKKQFAFLFIIEFFVVLYAFTMAEEALKSRKVLLLIAFLLSIVTPDLIERSYYLNTQGHFTTKPVTGKRLITASLYLSQDSDDQLLLKKSTHKKKLFKQFREKINEHKLTREFIKRENVSFYAFYKHYSENYEALTEQVITPVLENYDAVDGTTLDIELTELSLLLIREHFTQFLTLYTMNMSQAVGGFFPFIILWVFLFFAIFYYIRMQNTLLLLVLFTSLLSLSNLIFVALFSPVTIAHAIYTTSPLQTIFIIFIYTLFKDYRPRTEAKTPASSTWIK